MSCYAKHKRKRKAQTTEDVHYYDYIDTSQVHFISQQHSNTPQELRQATQEHQVIQDNMTTHGGPITEEYDYAAMNGITHGESITNNSHSNVVMTSNPAYIQAYSEHSNIVMSSNQAYITNSEV